MDLRNISKFRTLDIERRRWITSKNSHWYHPSQDQIDVKTNFLDITHRESDCPSENRSIGLKLLLPICLFAIISNEMAITANVELKFTSLKAGQSVRSNYYKYLPGCRQDVVDYGASKVYPQRCMSFLQRWYQRWSQRWTKTCSPG